MIRQSHVRSLCSAGPPDRFLKPPREPSTHQTECVMPRLRNSLSTEVNTTSKVLPPLRFLWFPFNTICTHIVMPILTLSGLDRLLALRSNFNPALPASVPFDIGSFFDPSVPAAAGCCWYVELHIPHILLLLLPSFWERPPASDPPQPAFATATAPLTSPELPGA